MIVNLVYVNLTARAFYATSSFIDEAMIAQMPLPLEKCCTAQKYVDNFFCVETKERGRSPIDPQNGTFWVILLVMLVVLVVF